MVNNKCLQILKIICKHLLFLPISPIQITQQELSD